MRSGLLEGAITLSEIENKMEEVFLSFPSIRAVLQSIRSIQSMRQQRKQVEILFAHMKRSLKVYRLRTRGLSGARDEFLLTAMAQNPRRMAIVRGTGPPENWEMTIA